MAYTAEKPTPPPSAAELRARIPGWGADLDPKDRPSFPRERRDLDSGAHWDFPERQPEKYPRERSIEHKFTTPVFGTAQPPQGVSGAIRRFSYARFSEGRAAHWLLLIAADRVNAVEGHLASFLTLRPDNPITETGILSEPRRRPISSRFGRNRVDLAHTWIDPILVAGPWVLAGWGVLTVVRRVARRK
ncbi:MAG TPA: hypothetical protein VIL55_08150 [Naasia sp.]|jgi:hypothetical protein